MWACGGSGVVAAVVVMGGVAAAPGTQGDKLINRPS